MVLSNWSKLATETFPEDHPDIGGWTFERVYKERKEFVKYIGIMFEVTGTYQIFQRYCKGKNAASE